MLGNVHNRRGTAVGADPQCTVLTHTPGAAGLNRSTACVALRVTSHPLPCAVPPHLLGLLLRFVVVRDGIGYQIVADQVVVNAIRSVEISGLRLACSGHVTSTRNT